MIQDIRLLVRLLFRIWFRYVKFCIKLIAAFWLLVFVVSIFGNCAHAETSGWFCDTESAARSDDVYQACGVSEGISEGTVRADALKAAIQEFNMVCEMSTDCRGRGRTLEPKRTTCTQFKNGIIKCVRLLEVRLYEK